MLVQVCLVLCFQSSLVLRHLERWQKMTQVFATHMGDHMEFLALGFGLAS